MIFGLILLVFAFVLLVVSGLVNPPVDIPRRLLSFGLACWVLAEILAHAAPLLHG